MLAARNVVVTLLVLATSSPILAAPYYYFQEVKPESPPAGQQIADAASQAADQLQQAGQQAQQLGPNGEPLPQRISGHINQLYSHGSSAMKGVVNSVHPDLKNIGHDITDAYHVTKQKVGERVEPFAQTVRPYIAHASKVVAPYVDHAAKEVPKLINQAGPALNKLSETVSNGVSGVWNRLKSGEAPKGVEKTGETIVDRASNVGKSAEQAAESVQQAAQGQQAAAA